MTLRHMSIDNHNSKGTVPGRCAYATTEDILCPLFSLYDSALEGHRLIGVQRLSRKLPRRK